MLGKMVAFGSSIMFLVSMGRRALLQPMSMALQHLPVNVDTTTSALLIHMFAIMALLIMALCVQHGVPIQHTDKVSLDGLATQIMRLGHRALYLGRA
jgi:hypothetical protein